MDRSEPLPLRTASVDCRHLADTSHIAGRDFQVIAPVVRPDDFALQGWLQLLRLRSGLRFHAADTVDLHDLTTQVVREPGLTLTIFLAGSADISLGRNRYQPGRATPAAPHGFALSCTEPDLFVRQGIRGNQVRKVGITVPLDWLEMLPEGRDQSIRQHGAARSWEPSARQVKLAQEMLDEQPACPFLASLHRESRALEIVTEALAILTGTPDDAAASSLTDRERSRLRIVHDYLMDEHDEITLEAIARHAGMSESAVQRLFRAAHGMSVFEYARAQRLEQARLRLEQSKVSVTEAAFSAGYSSPANFATAFKRHFGVSPSDVRRRR